MAVKQPRLPLAYRVTLGWENINIYFAHKFKQYDNAFKQLRYFYVSTIKQLKKNIFINLNQTSFHNC